MLYNNMAVKFRLKLRWGTPENMYIHVQLCLNYDFMLSNKGSIKWDIKPDRDFFPEMFPNCVWVTIEWGHTNTVC